MFTDHQTTNATQLLVAIKGNFYLKIIKIDIK